MSDLFLEIPKDSDMAKALIENSDPNLFLVLKKPGHGGSIFRAQISSWAINGDGLVSIEFDSWERYMDRYAQLAGI